jgi:hypothetical protein
MECHYFVVLYNDEPETPKSTLTFTRPSLACLHLVHMLNHIPSRIVTKAFSVLMTTTKRPTSPLLDCKSSSVRSSFVPLSTYFHSPVQSLQVIMSNDHPWSVLSGVQGDFTERSRGVRDSGLFLFFQHRSTILF